MKMVVLDGYTENPGDLSWAELEALGELTVYDRTSYTESPLIAERIGDAEIVVMNKTPISRHAGNWASNPDWCYWDYPLIELEGKTIGIIGFGRIGQAEGRIARAMGMRVLAYDVYPNDAGRAIGEYVDLDTLLAQSDVVSLHCNLTPENTGIINRENIAKMKDGAILINNARGQLIVEQDVADALNSGKLAAAGLDVVYTEPIREDNPLLTAKNCIITPHISWAPKESRQRIMDVTAENIRAFLAGTPQNVVNGPLR